MKVVTPFGVRMPDDLKEWVKEQGERADRSMNWIIVKLIEKAKQEQEQGRAS